MVHVSMLTWHFVITETWDGNLNVDYLGTRSDSGVGELDTVHQESVLAPRARRFTHAENGCALPLKPSPC